MTLKGVIGLILHHFTEFDCIAGLLRHVSAEYRLPHLAKTDPKWPNLQHGLSAVAKLLVILPFLNYVCFSWNVHSDSLRHSPEVLITFCTFTLCYWCASVVCFRWCLWRFRVFTALHVMQTLYSDENSVCLSVCHTRILWQNGRKICPDFYSIAWLVGGNPFYLKFWVNRPPLEQNRRFSTDNRS